MSEVHIPPGHALTTLHSTTLSSVEELLLPSLLCHSLLPCSTDGDARSALIARCRVIANSHEPTLPSLPSLLLTKLTSSLLHSANIYSHSIMKETRLARLPFTPHHTPPSPLTLLSPHPALTLTLSSPVTSPHPQDEE